MGIGAGRAPSREAVGEQRRALEAAVAAGPGLVERAERRENRRSRAHNNGWLVAGRYIGDYGRYWLARAVVARTALGANTRPETVYPLALTDSQGRPLSGRHRYTLRFPRGQLPPVGAFWSLTMYNDDRFLVENRIDRYAVGDRTPAPARQGRLAHRSHRPLAAARRGGPGQLAARARGPVPPRDAPLRAQAERSERALAPPATAPSLTDVSPAAALGTLDVRPVSRGRFMEEKTVEKLDRVVVRFAGDSGDGMQLTGSRFTDATAMVGNDLATLPDFPAEIRAPAGTPHGVSAFQIHFASRDILTPGDHPNVLVAMNPAALITNVGTLEKGGTVIVNEDGFTDHNLRKAGYESNPLEDDSLDDYSLFRVPMTSMTVRATEEIDGITPRDAARCKNLFALGLVSWMYGRPTEPTVAWVEAKFADKPQLAAANLAAFRAGYNFGGDRRAARRSLRGRSGARALPAPTETSTAPRRWPTG